MSSFAFLLAAYRLTGWSMLSWMLNGCLVLPPYTLLEEA